MDNVAPPEVVELTDEESALAASINFTPGMHVSDDVVRESYAAAAELAELLFARAAIPEIRIRYFTNPELNIGTKKSREEVFESNGTSGMQLDHFRKFARSEIRSKHLDRHDAADEFYKLALECGLTERLARTIRDAAKSTK